MKEIKINESPWQTLKIIVGSLVFVIGGYYMIINTEENLQEQVFNRVVGWLSVSFFGLGLVLGIYKLITNKSQVIINDLGVWKAKYLFSKYKEKDVVKWNEVRNVSVEKKESYIYIETDYDLLEIKLKNTDTTANKLVKLINKHEK